jgi:hypothetical protein
MSAAHGCSAGSRRPTSRARRGAGGRPPSETRRCGSCRIGRSTGPLPRGWPALPGWGIGRGRRRSRPAARAARMVPARARLVNTCASVCACSCSVIWSVSTAICATSAQRGQQAITGGTSGTSVTTYRTPPTTHRLASEREPSPPTSSRLDQRPERPTRAFLHGPQAEHEPRDASIWWIFSLVRARLRLGDDPVQRSWIAALER